MDFVQSTNTSVWGIVDNHISDLYLNISEFDSESYGFWILGKSYSQINITPKKEKKCENFSCYEKSLKTNKICKPGIFKIYSMFNQ